LSQRFDLIWFFLISVSLVAIMDWGKPQNQESWFQGQGPYMLLPEYKAGALRDQFLSLTQEVTCLALTTLSLMLLESGVVCEIITAGSRICGRISG
jgi:hypothetical protein